MSDLSFAIHILATTIALSAAYALLMSVLKKEVNAAWIKGEAWLALISTGVSLGFSFGYLLSDGPMLATVSGLLLLLGLGNALALVVINQWKAGSESVYPAPLVPTVMYLSMILFTVLTAQFLLELFMLSQA